MAHTLHLAPFGVGKTKRALALLRDFIGRGHDGLPQIWVLTATRRQALSIRQRLIEQDETDSPFFNIEFFNFYTLNARLLKMAGAPVRRLDGIARGALLRRLLAQMLAEGQLEYFRRIADTRGFITILAALIDELKQAKVEVERFAAAANGDKEREIARIYRRYQDLLTDSGLADVEGEGWLALAKLRERRELARKVDLLLVDGYDQFTLVQAQMLAELARAIADLHITLTELPEARANSFPQRSALARERLQSAFGDAGLRLERQTTRPAPDERHKDLEHLSRRIFRDELPASCSDAIHMLAAPNPAEETKSVLRAIKRQLLAGVRPEDMLIALRDWDLYATHFDSGRAEYELPLHLSQERALHTEPVIAAFIDLLALAPDFRRRDLLDVLRSPFIDAGFSAEMINQLDRLSAEQRFLGGDLAAWQEIVELGGQLLDAEGDDRQPALMTRAQIDELIARLTAFFEGVTPPERADAFTYIQWLERLIGADPRSGRSVTAARRAVSDFSLRIFERARSIEDDPDAGRRRDVNALLSLRRVLRQLLSSDDVLRPTFDTPPLLDWSRFRSDLAQALEAAAVDADLSARAGQILVTTAAEARGLPHSHVYILGLADSLFPAEISEEPLFLDSERESIRARGIPLATQSERSDDQGLFYELISLPQESLTLSRPTIQGGKVWLESHLWRAVTRVFPKQPVVKQSLGAVINPQDAANGSELLLAVANQLNAKDPAEAEDALRMRSWIERRAEYVAQWRRVAEGRRVELGRLSFSPFDQYSGLLSHPRLLGAVARQLGSERVWSATQLKDYGLCGYRFFAKRILKLDAVEEPEAGIDALQLGQLVHSILEATYRRIRTRGLAIHVGNQEAALSLFDELAPAILQDAPQDFGFRAGAAWHEEAKLLRKRLAALIRLDFSDDSPLSRFGERRQVRMLERRFDDARIEMPGDMAALRVSGKIDRIDWADDELALVDYKTGSGAISRRQMEIGRDFQMFIYAQAMDWAARQSQSESRLTGGLFWRLRNLKPTGVYSADNEDDKAALEAARLHIARNVRQGRLGQFPAQATKSEAGKCVSYCEYARFCRQRVTNRHKALPQA